MTQENHAKIHHLHRLYPGCAGIERSRTGPAPLSSGQELLCIYDGTKWEGLYLAVLKSPLDSRLKGQWVALKFVHINGAKTFQSKPTVRLITSDQALETYLSTIRHGQHKRWANAKLENLAIDTLVDNDYYTRGKTNLESHGSLTLKDSRFIHLWIDPIDHARGVGWVMVHESCIAGKSLCHDADIPLIRTGIDGHKCKIQGKKWVIISAERKIPIKTSAGLKESRLVSWAQQVWPEMESIQTPSGKVKSVHNRAIATISYVYFVRLDTFTDPQATTGFYKVGKANAVPKRIRQFGNCSVVHLLACDSPTLAFRFEQELLTHFSEWRQEGTEILRMPHNTVQKVVGKMQELSIASGNSNP
jgi:hypothetical protein